MSEGKKQYAALEAGEASGCKASAEGSSCSLQGGIMSWGQEKK
jgi:hypothetical protein